MSTRTSMNDRNVRPPADPPGDNLFGRGKAKDSAAPKPERIKRTFHLDLDKVMLLEKLQYDRFQATGVKPELSSLVGEAIAMLSASGQTDKPTS